MQLSLRAPHLALAPADRVELIDRLRRTLARLFGAIRRVELTVTDINGPRGGDDKDCRLRVRGPAIGTIVVAERGADPLAAVTSAGQRAALAVVRALARRRRRRGGAYRTLTS